MIRYITFLVSAVELQNCLGCGKLIGYLSLRVVLSNKGRITHAQQQHLIGLLKFCRLLLNMVFGYSTGSCCVVCLGALKSDCVSFD